MIIDRMKKLPSRLLGLPLTAEWLVRTVLLVVFFVLLTLVASLGFLGWQSFQELGDQIEIIRQTEVNHERVVRKLSETAGKIQSQAMTALANADSKLLAFPARQRLKQLKDEMDERIKEGRLTTLSDTQEWEKFETSFAKYWERINEKTPVDWFGEREVMIGALDDLEKYVSEEREKNDREVQAITDSESRKEVAATIAVLAVGFIVAALTFYEIRKTLKKLSLAYSESSESRDYLISLLDSLDSGIVVISQDGKIETVSQSFRRLTGLAEEAGGDQTYKELFQDSPALIEKIEKELETPDEISRYQGRVESGKDRLLDVFASPLLIGEELRGLILVLVDVTDAARAQTELRRNRALSAVGQMTAQIAHEIKNPLGSIRFATEVLKRKGKIAEGDVETIAVIDRSVDHLSRVVAELSDFARPKELEQKRLNLNQLLEDILPMIADRLNTKKVGIEKHFSPDLPEGRYDATELKKLFLNLIINAIDASKAGSHIELRTSVNGSRQAIVDIIDHGEGMDKETLRRLFEPFYTTKEKGTGLGMAIAKKITELHKGDLVISSKKGEGTTATVRLPII
jgi:PAS domain S-box-containing protein